MSAVVAAGHRVTAETGASVLRAGGNAVDAAIAAAFASWVAEPLLTGPGAGGHMLVAGSGVRPTVLDFFVAAPAAGPRADLVPIDVSFGSTSQRFHAGASSVGVYGSPAGFAYAAERWGSRSLAELTAPAAQLARRGVPINDEQGYVFEILAGILTLTAESRAEFCARGVALGTGRVFASEDLATTIERLGRDGADPFYRGDIARAACARVAAEGGTLCLEDLAAYRVCEREPVAIDYEGHTVLTNPPPSAGGSLLALALGRLDHRPQRSLPPRAADLIDVMAFAQAARGPEFDAGLAEEGFLEAFLAAQLGSTTHIAATDASGLACSVTCTNGEGSGIVVPGSGIHLNNIMGEEDLSPLGFFTAPAGRRMPSMMAPTVVCDADGEVELVLGSAGSNRIRSAILQTLIGVVDHGRDAQAAIDAPRLHVEGGVLYVEPGAVVPDVLPDDLTEVVRFDRRNLFFGGVQAIGRDPRSGKLSAGGDPRRGGAVAFA